MAIRLKSSVGKSVQSGEIKKNAPGDVILVRQMLRANKFNVRAEGGFDAGLGKAILHFQKKARLKTQDGVVDPDAATFKALLPLYRKAVSEAKKAQWYQVKFNGKEMLVPEHEIIAIRDELFRAIQPSIKKMVSRHNHAMELYRQHIRVAQQKEGFAASVMQWASIKLSGVDYPSDRTIFLADCCIADLNIAVKKKDLIKTRAALCAAEPAVNKFNKEMRAFHEGIIEGSSTGIKALEVTSDTSFFIFEALAAAVLIKTAGNKANYVAANGTAFLKSSAQQYGRYLAGKEVSFYGVAIDIGAAVGTSFLGKSMGKYIDQKKLIGITGKKFAQQIRKSALPISITNKQGEKFIEKHARGAFKGAIKGAVDSALKESEQAFKRGRLPNFDEIMDHAADVISASIAGMAMGAFEKQRPKFAHKLKNYMGDKTILNSIKNIKRGKIFISMSETNKRKVLDETMKRFGTKGTDLGLKLLANQVLDDPGKANLDKAVKDAAEDNEVCKAFEKALDEAIMKIDSSK